MCGTEIMEIFEDTKQAMKVSVLKSFDITLRLALGTAKTWTCHRVATFCQENTCSREPGKHAF
jgi:hypothetical protein